MQFLPIGIYSPNLFGLIRSMVHFGGAGASSFRDWTGIDHSSTPFIPGQVSPGREYARLDLVDPRDVDRMVKVHGVPSRHTSRGEMAHSLSLG